LFDGPGGLADRDSTLKSFLAQRRLFSQWSYSSKPGANQRLVEPPPPGLLNWTALNREVRMIHRRGRSAWSRALASLRWL